MMKIFQVIMWVITLPLRLMAFVILMLLIAWRDPEYTVEAFKELVLGVTQ